MRTIRYMLCVSVFLVAAGSIAAQSSVPLPNGKSLELKPSAPPEKVTFPEIKPPEKGTGTTGGGSGGIKEHVLEMGKDTYPEDRLRFLSDGKTLLFASQTLLSKKPISVEKKVIALDVTTGKTKTLAQHTTSHFSDRLFDVAADEKSFYVLESEPVDKGRVTYLRQYDIATGNPLGKVRLPEEKGSLLGFAIAGDGKTVLTSLFLESTIATRLCDLSTGKTIKNIASTNFTDLEDRQRETPAYAAPALALLATRIGDTKEKDLAIRLYDARTGAFQREIKIDQDTEKGRIAKFGVQISPDGKMLALAPPVDKLILGKEVRGGRIVRVFDPSTGALKKSFPVSGGNVAVLSLAFSPQGDKLALCCVIDAKEAKVGDRISATGMVVVHDVVTGKELKSWRMEGGAPLVVAFSPDGSMLAASGERNADKRSETTGVIHILRLSGSSTGDAGKQPAVKLGTPTPEALAELQRLNAQFPQFGGGGGANAIANYQQQIKDNPNNADLHLGLGQAHAGQNQYAEAATALQKAVDLAPKNPAPRQALAEVLTSHARDAVKKGDWDEAAQRARQAVALQPANAQPHHLLAQSLLQQKEIEAAGKHLKEAHARGLQDAALAAKIAEQLVKLGQAQAKNDPNKAIEHLRLAVDIESQQATHHAQLGKALRSAGRAIDAVEPLTTAMRLDPMDASHKLAFATLMVELGRYRDAEPVLHSILLNRPDDKTAQAALIETLLRQGRQAEAKLLAQQALKGGLTPADLPEVVRIFLDADRAGKTFQLPGLPSIVGLSAADAKKTLESAGIKVSFQVGAEAPSAGQVNAAYAMDPEPGAPLGKDTVVTVTLYGPVSAANANLALIPDLSGLSAKDAKNLLTKEGLTGKFQLGKAAPTELKSLTVAQTEPAAGMRVAKGSEVIVTLYAQYTGTPDGLIAVPDLAGFTAAKAKQALEEMGMKANFQLGKAAPTKDKSLTVQQTEPAVGARVAKGAEIKVTLFAPHDGKNPDPPEPKDAITVPDCLTLSLDEATAKLKAAGFNVMPKVGRPATFAGQIERVYQMDRAPGSRVRPGETIQLLIYGNRKEKP